MRNFFIFAVCLLVGTFAFNFYMGEKIKKPLVQQTKKSAADGSAGGSAHVNSEKSASDESVGGSAAKPAAVHYVLTGNIDASDLADTTSFEQTKKLAEEGNVEKQIKLAEMYYSGLVVEENGKETINVDSRLIGKMVNSANINYEKAAKWYKKAAEQGSKKAQEMLNTISIFEQIKKSAEAGNAESQFKLAEMYHYGKGIIAKHREEAMNWYTKAAEQGHIAAQNQLAYMYSHPISRFVNEINKGNIEAAKWYRKAAEQGSKEAQYELGRIYYYGTGVEQDYIEAAKWYKKAAQQGHIEARRMLDRIGDSVAEQTKKVSVFERTKESAEAGNAESQLKLAKMYYDANGVKKDYAEAAKWYKEAAEQGLADAQYKLAKMYAAVGRGVDHDFAAAAKYYESAAEQGHADAQFELGRLYYYNNQGVKRDQVEAVNLYKKAAKQGHVEAQYWLGSAYLDEEDYAEAVKWFKKAVEKGYRSAQDQLNRIAFVEKTKKSAEAGNAEGQFELGKMYYYSGTGVKQDRAKAAIWLGKAAEQGHAEAQKMLTWLKGK
ncbi:MAG: SEL1-like repeat protein [Endomicrobia bacterium]|nr:SEL1-like repeat protein [Endomicrobiia bacterium]MCL2799335.1 SEL1-like repeat protein [Endomicrobiia bacterium]